MRKEIDDGQMIPRGYGIAWYLPERKYNSTVCYPIPLNSILGFFRLVYFIVRGGFAVSIYRVDKYFKRKTHDL